MLIVCRIASPEAAPAPDTTTRVRSSSRVSPLAGGATERQSMKPITRSAGAFSSSLRSEQKSELYCDPSSGSVLLRFFAQGKYGEYIEVSLRLSLSAPIISRSTLSAVE
jgi:hypothetical protein